MAYRKDSLVEIGGLVDRVALFDSGDVWMVQRMWGKL